MRRRTFAKAIVAAGTSLIAPHRASARLDRDVMGDTRRFAERIDLVAMEPRGDLSSTGYLLAAPSVEYLVLQPSETAEPFSVALEAGTYSVEWFSITSREMKEEDAMTVPSDGSISFTVPFAESGPVILYLKQAGQ